MKYRRKPIIIDAHQVFENDNTKKYPDWLLKELNAGNVTFTEYNFDIGFLGHVKTRDGKFLIPNGYFIVKTQDELEILDSEDFYANYERVD